MDRVGATEKPDNLVTPTRANSGANDAWQRRVLPLMKGVVIGLTAFFFLVTLAQLTYLHYELSQPRPSGIPAMANALLGRPTAPAAAGAIPPSQLALAAELESEATTQRYEMANAILMAHLWIRYLGFMTGMIMAVLGSVFILGKLSETTPSRLQADTRALKVSLTSASPGVVLAVLGCILMITTVVAQQETRVVDQPLYRPFAPDVRTATPPEQLPEFFKNRTSTPGQEKPK